MPPAELAYDDRGSGPVLVLVHGHPFSRAMWAPQLLSLSRELRVVAPDLPGYGDSPPLGEVAPMSALSSAVLGLLDRLEIERATIAGLSMGGLVAMELGLAHPDRVAGLVLAATTAAPLTDGEADRRRRSAAQIEESGMLAHTAEMLPQLFGPAGSRDPEITVPIVTAMLRTNPAGAAAALRGRAERPDYERLLGDLRPPALVIAGDRDAYSTKEVTDQLVAALPHPEVLLLVGVGHLPNLESPERFDAAVRDFVLSCDRAPPPPARPAP